MARSSTRPTSARNIIIQKHIQEGVNLLNLPKDVFVAKDVPIPDPLPEDSALLQTLYVSNDPAQAIWIQNHTLDNRDRRDMSALPVGTSMGAFAISRVIEVGGTEKDGKIRVGDIVEARTYWADYTVVQKEKLTPVNPLPGVDISHYLGSLGLSGQTAYWALVGSLQPKMTDTLVISAAAGAIGNVAIQVAKKVLGVQNVIGIAGSEQKCTWLKGIGADEAVNYKRPTFKEDLSRAAPNGIDRYLDHVGGTILDEVMLHMNAHGVITACGVMSAMNGAEQGSNLKHYMVLLMNRLTLQGYTVMDYVHRFDEGKKTLEDAAQSGKLMLEGTQTVEDIQGRVEELPRVWSGLFRGSNTGKLLAKLAE